MKFYPVIKPALYFFFLAIFPATFAQQKTEDSLRAAIRQYDLQKELANDRSLSMADTIKADLLAELVVLNYHHKPDVAFTDAQEQLVLSKKIGYSWGIARAYEMQGHVYDYTRKYDKALASYQRAFAIYNRLGKLSAIDILNNIGVIYSKKGIYTEALKYLLEGLEMSQKANDPQGLVSTYNNIGIIYTEQQKYDDALFYYGKSLVIQLKDKELYSISNTYHNVGRIYAIKKNRAGALKNYTLGIESARKEGDNVSLANNYSGIGDMYLNAGQYSKAVDYHEPALKIREESGDSYGLVASLLAFGKIYHKTGDNQKAIQYAGRALSLVKTTGELDMLAQCYKLLAEITASTGNYKAAFDNQNLYKQYSDSLFNAENERKLVQQQMNFDFKNIQEKKDLQAKEALENQKNIRNYTIAGLTLLGLFIVTWLVWRHKKSSLKKQKEYNNELTRKEFESQALKIENENIQLKNDLMAVEKEFELKEKEKLQDNLEFNRRELASTTLYLFQKNQKLSELKTEIDALKHGTISGENLERLRTKIQENLYLDADWDKFKLHFEQVHPNFFTELDNKHPGLTNYEVRLYSYLHMKLSTKEIAGLLNITPASVIKAKGRLNKKLNRGSDTDEVIDNDEV